MIICQKRNDKDHIIAAGNSGNVEYRLAGQKNTPMLKFSIPAGRNADDSVKWLNCVAWGGLANYGKAAGLAKGDNVVAFGVIEINEREGKTYTQLRCDGLLVCKAYAGTADAAETAGAPNGFNAEQELNEDDLPF